MSSYYSQIHEEGVKVLVLLKNGMCWQAGEFKDFDVLVKDGQIDRLLARSGAEKPPEEDQTLEIVDLEGKKIYPGFIDAHTHAGIFEEKAGGFAGNDVNETSSPTTAGVRAIDALNPFDPGIEEARNAGYTTICVLPGSANVIGGEGVVVKTAGTVVDRMQVKTPKRILKMAFGRNPQWTWSAQKKAPYTRLSVAALLREKLMKAKDYMEKDEKDREYDYDMEILADLLNDKATARIHVANLEDIETITRVAAEFQFNYTLEHATALHLNPEFAAGLDAPVILGPLNVAGKSFQTYDLTFNSVRILHEAGLELSMMTDAPVIPLNLGIIQMWLIDRLRIPRKEIVEMFTINPARVLGIDESTGSIEEGKQADFAVFDGDCFDAASRVTDTFIAGKRVGGDCE